MNIAFIIGVAIVIGWCALYIYSALFSTNDTTDLGYPPAGRQYKLCSCCKDTSVLTHVTTLCRFCYDDKGGICCKYRTREPGGKAW